MSIVTRVVTVILGSFLTITPATAAEPQPAWTPTAWQEESTVELRTQAPGEEAHWFKVWFVVLDGQLYVRLGGRASKRFEDNTTRPVIAVRIAGKEFPRVTGVPVPDMAEQVAAAMADKHWSDVFVRYMDHPLTLRLTPE
jgi:hypothetical protein